MLQCSWTHRNFYRNTNIRYDVEVYYKEKKQRIWRCIPNGIFEHKYRALNMDERRIHDEENNLRFVTKDEIYDAKLELWNLLKPKQD